MVSVIPTLPAFLVALIVSAAIICFVTKLSGETEHIKTALIEALVGIVWLLIVQHLCSIGRVKSPVIAVVVWLVTSVVGMFLPVL
jgi:hypothetical protein